MPRRLTGGPRTLLAALVALFALAGAAGLFVPRPAPPVEAGDAPQSLSAIVARGEPQPGYWTLPVAPQGTPPDHFSDREASLAPETCGACHPSQFAGWQGSLHARATSPGLRGQVVDLLEHDPASGLDCLTCHAPLAEGSSHCPRCGPGSLALLGGDAVSTVPHGGPDHSAARLARAWIVGPAAPAARPLVLERI